MEWQTLHEEIMEKLNKIDSKVTALESTFLKETEEECNESNWLAILMALVVLSMFIISVSAIFYLAF